MNVRSLDQVRIARPCPARWEDMAGDERVRFCALCSKSVYNLSAISRDEAAKLIEEREGEICARLYRRRDGTILTSDCPVGARAAFVRLVSRVAAATASILLIFGGRYFTPDLQEKPHGSARDTSRLDSWEISDEDREMLGSLGYITLD